MLYLLVQVGGGAQGGKVDDPELYRNDEAALKGEYKAWRGPE